MERILWVLLLATLALTTGHSWLDQRTRCTAQLADDTRGNNITQPCGTCNTYNATNYVTFNYSTGLKLTWPRLEHLGLGSADVSIRIAPFPSVGDTPTVEQFVPVQTFSFLGGAGVVFITPPDPGVYVVQWQWPFLGETYLSCMDFYVPQRPPPDFTGYSFPTNNSLASIEPIKLRDVVYYYFAAAIGGLLCCCAVVVLLTYRCATKRAEARVEKRFSANLEEAHPSKSIQLADRSTPPPPLTPPGRASSPPPVSPRPHSTPPPRPATSPPPRPPLRPHSSDGLASATPPRHVNVEETARALRRGPERNISPRYANDKLSKLPAHAGGNVTLIE